MSPAARGMFERKYSTSQKSEAFSLDCTFSEIVLWVCRET
jgi:hypothetical protein